MPLTARDSLYELNRVPFGHAMKLGFEEEQTPYENPSQSARFWTEAWVRAQVYCPNCGREDISKYANNKPVADFFCATCREDYELKSQKARFGAKMVDGAFRTMCERVASTNNPNLMLMNYDIKALSVKNLCVIPKQFFVREIIEERKPLAPTARRAGWVGCNILLREIPEAGRYSMSAMATCCQRIRSREVAANAIPARRRRSSKRMAHRSDEMC